MRFILLMCAFAMPACSNQTPSIEETASSVAAAVNAGVDAQRGTTLRTTVVSAGHDCPAVTRTFFQGTDPDDGAEYWNIACGTSGNYTVVMRAGAESVATSCAAAKATTGVDCFTPFETER